MNTASYLTQQASEHGSTAGHLLFMTANGTRAAGVKAVTLWRVVLCMLI